MSLHPKFEPLSDGTGLDVIDPVETRHFSLFTDAPVTPTPAETTAFTFPVSTACRISTDHVRLPYMIPVDVRTPDGDHLVSVDTPTSYELSNDEYLLELHSPIKVYLRVTGCGRIETTTEGVTFEFDEAVPVEVGARSYHSAPATTITVPDDPEAMMEAVSAFSSALKTTSAERAWPTLRGHPPRVERGTELVIPDELEAPDTGIRITVPSEYWAVYTVASLAYYLGAEVVAGDDAIVTTETGVAHHLGDGPSSVADATEALLKRVFFLDCVTRTEGLYPDDLHERTVLESHVDLDLESLYDASPAERLDAYLSVPDEAVEAIESPWHRVTHVESDPGPEAGELLPYVVNDLSLVRPKMQDDDPPAVTEADEELNDEIDEFLRRPSASEVVVPDGKAVADGETVADGKAVEGGDGDFVRSVGSPTIRSNSSGDANESDNADFTDNESASRGVPELDEYVSLPEVDALEQAWVGDGTPLRGTKLIREAFTNETPEPSDGTVEITVVCNDSKMREELDSVGEIYGSRDDVRVDVTEEFGVSADELRERLAEDTDVFHFIGHIDGNGFQCPDGILDAATVEEINATAILLNGCRSHDQGVELVKAGANVAVVSLADLYNSGAVEVGETLAELLHHGFSVGSAMKIIREYTSMGNRYVVVGDPSIVIVQYERLVPTLYQIRDRNENTLTVEPQSYPTRGYAVGTTVKPLLFESDKYQIISGSHKRVTTTKDNLQEAIISTRDPIIDDGQLVWSRSWFT